MRTWVGQEMEGYCREMTLFVEATNIDKELAKRIVSYAKDNKIKRLYLGAGRISTALDDDAKSVLNESGLTMVIETASSCYDLCLGLNATVVVRLDMPFIDYNPNLVLKVDSISSWQDKKPWCAVSNGLTYTDLDGLSNGMYEDDKEVQI